MVRGWARAVGPDSDEPPSQARAFLRKESIVAAGVCVIAFLGAGAGTASAGEITGNGKPTGGPSHANSICVFSGQNDTPNAEDPRAGARSLTGSWSRRAQPLPQRATLATPVAVEATLANR
jgi:hypothetical protein